MDNIVEKETLISSIDMADMNLNNAKAQEQIDPATLQQTFASIQEVLRALRDYVISQE